MQIKHSLYTHQRSRHKMKSEEVVSREWMTLVDWFDLGISPKKIMLRGKLRAETRDALRDFKKEVESL